MSDLPRDIFEDVTLDYEIRMYGLQEPITFDFGCLEYTWDPDMTAHFQMMIDQYYEWRGFFLDIDFATFEFEFSPPSFEEIMDIIADFDFMTEILSDDNNPFYKIMELVADPPALV